MGEQKNIYDRSYEFAREILLWIRSANPDHISRSLTIQLVRSSTSIGANLQEAYAASSRKDFINKISIALREARESYYWLQLLRDSDDNIEKEQLSKHIQEANELSNILGKIRVNSMASKPEPHLKL